MTIYNQNGTQQADVLAYSKSGTYYAFAGQDSISISGGSVVVYAGPGNNVIRVSGGANHLIMSEDTEAAGEKNNSNDQLTVFNCNVVNAILGSGKDEVVLHNTDGRSPDGVLSKIKGGSWGDSFTTSSSVSNYQLYGDAGNDQFDIKGGSNLVLWGGAANDTFNLSGGTNIKAYGGDSADTFNIFAQTVQNVILGYGNDVVNVTAGNKHQIKGNLGINTINLSAGSGHVITSDIDQAASQKAGKQVGYGVDKVYINGASQVTANLGDGKDIVEVLNGSGHRIYTEGWGDTLKINGEVTNSILDAGDGDDQITAMGGSNNYLYGGAGNDVIEVSRGKDYKIFGGDGNDNITVKQQSGFTINTGNGNNTVTVTGTPVGSTYGNPGTESGSIIGGNGKDVVKVSAMKHIDANLGYGNDEIEINGIDNIRVSNVTDGTINLGEGTNVMTIRNGGYLKVNGGTGADTITVYAGSHIIKTAAGDDTVLLYSNKANIVDTGEGNDTILLGDRWDNSYINAGAGDDVIEVSSSGQNLIEGGTGDDVYRVNSRGSNVVIDNSTAGSNDRDVLVYNTSLNYIAQAYYDKALDLMLVDNMYIKGFSKLSTIMLKDATFNAQQVIGMVDKLSMADFTSEFNSYKNNINHVLSYGLDTNELAIFAGYSGK